MRLGSELYSFDNEDNIMQNISIEAQNSINVIVENYNPIITYNNSMTYEEFKNYRNTNMINHIIRGILFFGIDIGLWSAEYGYEHNNIPFKLLYWIIFIWILIIIFGGLMFPIALFYLIYKGIKILINKMRCFYEI